MESNPLTVYPRLYLHVLKLTGRAVARRWPWLLVAPAVAMLLMVATGIVLRLVPGIAGGFLLAFVRAALLSLVLYVGRSILEQRSLSGDDLTAGLGAFLGDVLTFFFALWIVGMLLGFVAPPLVLAMWLAVIVMPTAETMALTPVAGLSMFTSAWSFFRREALPWLGGHLPLLLLVPVHLGWKVLVGFVPVARLPAALHAPVWDLLDALPWVLWFMAFLYRGVLFLTLDGMSPMARAQRFGASEEAR